MSRFTLLSRLLVLVGPSLAFGCGGGDGDVSSEDPGGNRLGFEIHASRAVLGDVGAFQLSLRKSNGGRNACAGLTQTCLHEQVQLSELVSFTAAGGSARALRVGVRLTAEGEYQTQNVELRDVPVGRDYGLVVEALTRTDPPQLLAISCSPGIEVRRGENALVIAQPLDLPDGGPVACNPVID